MQKKISDFQTMMRAGSGLSYSDYIKSVTPPILPSQMAYQSIQDNGEGDKDYQYEQLANRDFSAIDAQHIKNNPEWFDANGLLKTDKMSPMHRADTLWRQGGKKGPSPILAEQRRQNGYSHMNSPIPKHNVSFDQNKSAQQIVPTAPLPPAPTFNVQPWQTLGIKKQGGLFGNKTVFPGSNRQAYLNSAFGAQNQLPVPSNVPPMAPMPPNVPVGIPASMPQSPAMPHFISNMDRFRTTGSDQNLAEISALVDARIKQMAGRR